MDVLYLLIGLALAGVLLVGVGERVRLPWPALMVLLGAAVAVVPGLPDRFEIEPELILPLFLPPLLYATATRTSWAMFRSRWRSVVLLAVALVAATVALVAGTAVALVPGITISAAVALGAMVAPPDPVAVEAVAGSVEVPRRLLTVLQSEGLFNDATALVIFQGAVAATVHDDRLHVLGLLGRFALGVVAAVAIGVVVAWLARRVVDRITTSLGRSALTLILPFAVYLLADEVGASGVVAVVVLALQLGASNRADEVQERLVQSSFWDVVELIVTAIAFGLIGLDVRQVAEDAGSGIWRMLGHAGLVCVAVVVLRGVWLAVAVPVVRRSGDVSAAPRNGREAAVLTWCGMRGLATLALALSVPATTASGAPFPARTEIVLIACSVLVVTLLLPGFTLPALISLLKMDGDADAEHAAEAQVVRRAHEAALQALERAEKQEDLSEDAATLLHQQMERLVTVLSGDSDTHENDLRTRNLRGQRDHLRRLYAAALEAARADVLAARREPGIDPEAADRVLRRLDQRTVLLE